MFIEHSPCEDPALNLALEEYCFLHLEPSEDMVLTYVNQPSVIIGRHQNAFDQVNLGVARQKGIPVIRRRSGGGAVYHDCGNLNFAFIGRYDRTLFVNYQRILTPVIDALGRMGITASFSAPNRILVEGKKISGNSQYSNMKRMVSHGTLLYETDVGTLQSVLEPNLDVVYSKGVRSEPWPVVNLSRHMESATSFVDFRRHFTRYLAGGWGGKTPLQLSSEAWEKINDLARQKYRRWEWNYGRSPEFSAAFPWENGKVVIDVAKGIVRAVGGDDSGLSPAEITDLRDRWVGRRLTDIPVVTRAI